MAYLSIDVLLLFSSKLLPCRESNGIDFGLNAKQILLSIRHRLVRTGDAFQTHGGIAVWGRCKVLFPFPALCLLRLS